MNALLTSLPTELLSPEREQALLQAGDRETIVLHTMAPAVRYVQSIRKSKSNITHAEIVSLAYAALSKSIKIFKPGMQSFLAYSKPFLRGEIHRYWCEKNVVRNAFRHEEAEADEFPKPLVSEHVEPSFEEIHWREEWTRVEPLLRQLAPQEIKVLEFRYRFGLTLQETGLRIGKSRERVRQIEGAAILKIRKLLI